MSIIRTKANQIWSKIKLKVENLSNSTNRVIVVQPKESMDNYDSHNIEHNINIQTEHLNTYRSIWKLIHLLASIVGLSAYEEIEINLRFIFTTSVICFAYPSLLYTMSLVWPDVSKLLEVICIFGVLMPATLKFRLVVKKVKYILSMNDFFEKILTKNAKGKRADFLEMEMKEAYKKVKIFVVITLLCFAVFSLYPIHVYVNENRLVPLMRIEFPFVDQTNMKGYLIGLAIMLLFGVLAVVGSVGFDLVILMLLLEYGSLVNHLVQDLEDYHEMWKNKTFSTKHQEYFLRNICLKYQDINSYIRYFNHLFAGNICHSICMLYGSLVCSVYAVFNNGWISGYGFCIFCFVQLYIPCILGTYVTNQNDKMNQALYSTVWYEYPVKVQRTFFVLLHASSFNTMELWIGPFAPLNVQTALTMTKNIYSYYTAMTNLT